MFAGHGTLRLSCVVCSWFSLVSSLETTAHTLAATFGFLAVNEEIQEEIVQHILEVVGTEREPVC